MFYFLPPGVRGGWGSSGQLGGGCGLGIAEKAAQYLAAQQWAQPTAGAGFFSGEEIPVRGIISG
ncbi:MAG TPA: hypothetical protein VFO93_12830 [Hymenobacter sp.]|uniref:hypothetical protein n=1 Tax=Hymenobacter sp. TaxID=1898978 RepID=UPI002D7EB4ED|nr:hypothetical protein [Hymenobacter sp.]HET9504419.1 hypothetical protein [Hymenobacter sp.]